ncbi:MAG: hypothetical protein ABDI07_08860 [Candidatus Kryptonium sp.]
MECGDYFIEFDKTGFPLIRKKEWDYFISLFPVSKYQFERFMIELGPQKGLYTDEWYGEILKLNPRSSWKKITVEPWKLFLTGVTKEEIFYFLEYLGKDFSLPTVSQWRNLFYNSDKIVYSLKRKRFSFSKMAPPARFWIKNGFFPLVKEGLLEMVIEGDKQYCIGKPWQELLPNLWRADEVKEVNWEVARRAVGFRVVKKLKL